MADPCERRWGMITVTTEWREEFEAYLPKDHRVIAVRHLDDGMDECIVSGPNMPVFRPGSAIERTDLLTAVDDHATYGYWAHTPHGRWIIS